MFSVVLDGDLKLFLSARDVFQLLATKYKKLDLSVGASFFEIYSGKASHALYRPVNNTSVQADLG